MNIVYKIVEDVEKLINEKKLKVIGIDGPGGAGKTTISQNLKEKLEEQGYKCIVLHIDDFITSRSIRYNNSFEEWYCHYVFQWRYNYLVEKILKPAKARHHIQDNIEFYEKHTDTYRIEFVNIGKNDIIILEGIFIQRAELREYLDYVIYMDIGREEVIKRVINRDVYIGNKEEILEKYNARYFPSEDRYCKTVKPKKRADFLIENEKWRVDE